MYTIMSNCSREINFARERSFDKAFWKTNDKMKVSLASYMAGFNWRQTLPRVRSALAVVPRGANPNLGYSLILPDIQVNFVRHLKRSLAKLILNWSANVAIAVAAITLVAFFGPRLVAMIKQPSAPDSTTAADYITNQNLLPINQHFEEFLPNEFVLPPVNYNLPSGDWLKIEAIGVNTALLTNEDATNLAEVNAILDKGVYLYPQFGDIGSQSQAVVLAAHHMNMVSTPWRDQNTFQNLQALQVGERVELIAGQRKWIYEVYAARQETEITDETADLIMYTCVYWWDNDLRHVVYARLLDPATYEQSATTALGVLLTGGTSH